MDQDIQKLLYTTKDGRWYWETDYAVDKLELDDEDIDFDRIPKIRELLIKPIKNWTELHIPFEAALVLASWGDEEGLSYLEYVIALRPDKWGNGEPHRLRGYDTTYEWVANAMIAFATFRSSYAEFDSKIGELERWFKVILNLCETQPFEFPLLRWIKRRNYTQFDAELKSYLRAMVSDDTGFHHYKPADAVAFFADYDPVYLDRLLEELGKSRSDYLTTEQS
ncbi:hypothetical protein [Alterisphingorhabdus coralli]|uniref:Uncharacterized protein n=1 Tax=Alterisphingorhabdus coralli TaxID=3071408 RepID=A0AA97F8T7_9SPHN|nr:hypothetical protein [Parasphingorhabdus sp. SCSIO 66989]WOE76078.1 hypothetical protein RB602_05000 [Parasphingorhabdus sp. SCSIO 66989]